MNPENVEEYLRLFRAHGCEPPSGYVWALQHDMFGFDSFTQMEPWEFCGPEEILPLSKRWPGNPGTFNPIPNPEVELIPFARLQGSDDLVCLKVNTGKVIGIAAVHYQINTNSPTEYWIEDSYETFWDWLRYAVSHIEFWSGIKNKRKSGG